MSKQFDGVCYTTQADAFVAACSHFNASSVLSSDGAFLTSVSCSSADENSMILRVQKTEVSTNSVTTSYVHQSPSLHDCMQTDYVGAAKSIFLALVLAWAPCYCLWKLKEYLDWSRSNE